MAQELCLVVPIFSSEELSPFTGQIRRRDIDSIQIACGCTSTRFGDCFGVLIISKHGTIKVTCLCNEACKTFGSPVEFAKHASRSTSKPNWRTKIWVLGANGQKFKLGKTCLVKYYKGDEYKRPHNEISHRDQFLSCNACKKVRRFELCSTKACRLYHDAAAKENRTCSDMIPGRWTCDDLEERSVRHQSGCRKKMNCKGCKYCVCFGCEACRFQDCKCRTCTDFYENAKPKEEDADGEATATANA